MPVYVLIDKTRTCCKIGYSKDMAAAEKRVKGLQTANPYGLEVYCINKHLSINDEQDIHRQLEQYRTGGGTEWFDFNAQQVIDCVEYIRSATLSMFEQVASKPLQPEKAQLAKCTCHCDHLTGQELKEFEIYGCDSCVDTWDENGECIFCIYEQSQLAEEICESFDEFENKCDEIAEDTYLNPDAWTLRHYLNTPNKRDLKPMSIKECFDFLIDNSCKTSGKKCRVADLVFRLTQCILDEDYNESYPCLFNLHGNLVLVLEGEFAETMEEAERRYIDCFFDVDECQSQLFVVCINKAREVKEVPYGIWRD